MTRPKSAIFPREIRLLGAIRDQWTCQLCGRKVQNHNPAGADYLIAGHITAWIDGGTYDLDNERTECRDCSNRGGGHITADRHPGGTAGTGTRTQARRAGSLTGPHHGEGRLFPVPTPAPLRPVVPLQLSVPEDFAGVPHMQDVLEVPAVSRWPRMMTGPNPRAVGSYGAELERISRDRDGTVLRWWQRLSLRRILEHDSDGVPVWPEWLWSTARQQGKSVGIRELAMWRLSAWERIGEAQQISLLSSVVRTADLVQEPARAWAKLHRADGWWARERNGAQAVIAPGDGLWAVHSPTSIYGSSTGLALVDEAWRIDPKVISEALEPTLSERRWGQLGLISTAHSRATALMIERRLDAIGDPETLLIEWSALPGCELDDREEWRRASPHWHDRREALIVRAHLRALTSTQLVGGEDPVAGFRSQWLNQWPTKTTRDALVKGDRLVPDGVWAGLAGEGDAAGGISFAVEDVNGRAVAVAAAGITDDGRTVVEAYELTDRRMAWAWIRQHAAVRPGCTVVVGAVLSTDQEVAELGVAWTTATYVLTRQSLSRFRASASRRVVLHTGSPVLTAQLEAFRVIEGQTGLRAVSGDPWEVLRAAAWAVHAAETERRGSASVW
jgi:hypothetical protein